MKKILLPVLICLSIYICGCCSIPRKAAYTELYSFTKTEKKIKGGFGTKRKAVLIKDFRENEMYDENITALKDRIEKYISSHPDLSEPTKNNLRELKVTAGATRAEVKLLLGEPDKVIKSGIWAYRTTKRSIFTIVVFPVFFTHDGYYLYFKNNLLTLIERRYLQQTLQTSDLGLTERKKIP